MFPRRNKKLAHSSLAIHHLIRTGSDLLEMDTLCDGTDSTTRSPEQYSDMLLVEFEVERP